MFDLNTTSVMEMTTAVLPSYTSLDNLSMPNISMDHVATAYYWLVSFFVWGNLWKLVLFISIAANFKNFPLVYHLRILNGIRFVLRSQRSSKPLTPDQLFQPLITSSKATLLETDVFGHKSNSTYFSDVDICRVHLVTTLFSKAIEDFRGSTTMNGLSGKPSSPFTMPLGAVSCSFRRELKPYEPYDMWTRILSWDEKWFYLVTHFVKKGSKLEPQEFTMYPRQNSISSSSASSRKGSTICTDRRESKDSTNDGPQSGIAASALSKIVFKEGRKTVAPETMLELAGLLPKKTSVESAVEEAPAGSRLRVEVVNEAPILTTGIAEKVEASDRDSDSGYDSASRRHSMHDAQEYWTRARIEAERKRGMKLAALLHGQKDLENELHDELALGRHYDGHGIEGVVATLAQLGKLSNYQLL